MAFKKTSRASISAATFAAGVILCVPPCRAGVENLVSNSPFLPQSAVAQKDASGALSNYELRGVASIGGVPTFSIYDTSANRGYWIPLNGAEAGIRVQSYDAAREAVVLEGEGGTRRLGLKEAQIQTMAPSQPAVNASAVPPQASPLPAAPGVNATEQEMAERRQRIIEELRRRRALRQQTQAQQQ